MEYLNHNYGVDVPLVLMNSFNSHMSTVEILHKYVASAIARALKSALTHLLTHTQVSQEAYHHPHCQSEPLPTFLQA